LESFLLSAQEDLEFDVINFKYYTLIYTHVYRILSIRIIKSHNRIISTPIIVIDCPFASITSKASTCSMKLNVKVLLCIIISSQPGN